MHPLLRRLRRRFPETIQIGRYRIRLPLGSSYLDIRTSYPRYDAALGQIADALLERYPDLAVIDVGANVGDTAAVIRRSVDIPVLCIEGDDAVLKFLRKNAGQMPGVVIEPCFVGEDGQRVDASRMTARGLNASMADAVSPTGTIKLRSLESIVAGHPEFARSKLIKVDAEGFDFDIILHSESLIRSTHPVLFFEYNPFEYRRGISPNERTFGPSVLNRLAEWGYVEFLYFDSRGSFFLSVSGNDQKLVRQLHGYLELARKNGDPGINYFDVCAIHAEDAGLRLSENVRAEPSHLAMVP